MPDAGLVEALKKCRTQFASYAEQHAAKGTPEADRKARVNREFAVMCTDALATFRPVLPREGEWVTVEFSQEAKSRAYELVEQAAAAAGGYEVTDITILRALNAAAPPFPDRQGEVEDNRTEELKAAFVAGCCAVLTWTNSAMPQDDLDEAGYDYAASVTK